MYSIHVHCTCILYNVHVCTMYVYCTYNNVHVNVIEKRAWLHALCTCTCHYALIMKFIQNRSNLFNIVTLLCEETEKESSTALTYKTIPSFLLSDADLHRFTMEELPREDHSLFNACIMTSQHTSVWPLIINPLGMVERWLNKRTLSEETVFVQYEVQGHVHVP